MMGSLHRPQWWHVAAWGAVAITAIVLRTWQLGSANFWLDESFTVHVTNTSFWGMFGRIAETESTPPLHYMLVWVVGHVFGFSEIALRSLSVVAGVGTVGVGALAARNALGGRAAFVTATLLATNPLLVWYSREARSYSLYVFLCALSIWALAIALQRRTYRWLALWVAVAGLAMTSHYFAAFVVFPQFAMLCWYCRSSLRPGLWVAAAAGIAVVGLLVPLARSQSDTRSAWISSSSLLDRLADTAQFVIFGYWIPARASGLAFSLLVVVVFVCMCYLLLRVYGSTRERRHAAALTLFAGLIVVQPLIASILIKDVFVPRNILPLILPIVGVIAVAAGSARVPRRWMGAVVIIFAITGIGATVRELSIHPIMRTDWRSAAKSIPHTAHPQVLLVVPQRKSLGVEQVVFRSYRRDTIPQSTGTVNARRIFVVVQAGARDVNRAVAASPTVLISGFSKVHEAQFGALSVTEYRADTTREVTVARLQAHPASQQFGASVLVENGHR